MRTLISLGYRCETAFQIRIHSGVRTSHFFDWIMAPHFASVTAAIASDFDVLRPEDITVVTSNAGAERLYDGRAKFSIPHAVPTEGKALAPGWRDHLPKYLDKMRFLAGRFRETVKAQPVTFIRRGATLSQAQALEAALRDRFPAADMRVLYVVGTAGETFESGLGHAVAVEDVDEYGDDCAWADMLMAQGLITAPFRLARPEFVKGAYGLGAPPLTLEVARRALDHNPGSAWYHYEAARAAHRAGDLNLAAAYAGRAADMDAANETFAGLARHVRALRERAS